MSLLWTVTIMNTVIWVNTTSFIFNPHEIRHYHADYLSDKMYVWDLNWMGIHCYHYFVHHNHQYCDSQKGYGCLSSLPAIQHVISFVLLESVKLLLYCISLWSQWPWVPLSLLTIWFCFLSFFFTIKICLVLSSCNCQKCSVNRNFSEGHPN